jgi:hypothetical protein
VLIDQLGQRVAAGLGIVEDNDATGETSSWQRRAIRQSKAKSKGK